MDSSLDALLRLPDILALTKLGKTTIYAMIKRGDFPAPRRIGLRAVAWREKDIKAWLNHDDKAKTIAELV